MIKKQLIVSLLTLLSLNIYAQEVRVSGAMSNVMRKGQLEGTIYLDTISNKNGLYGLGPKEFLKGELLIIDGKSFVSSVDSSGSVKMEETFDVKAPFFVYSNVADWDVTVLPLDIKTMQDLEQYINVVTQNSLRPFTFKLAGTFAKVNYHIQNLPDGTIVRSPKDAHQGQGKFERTHVNGEIIGFFSTQHQSIFTHHDTYIHMHYINNERTEMGHIDDLIFSGSGEIKLYLPK